VDVERLSGRGNLVELETEGLGKLSLVVIEAVEAVDAEFEGCCHVQRGPQCGCPVWQWFAGTVGGRAQEQKSVKPRTWKNAIARVLLELEQRRTGPARVKLLSGKFAIPSR